MSRPVTISISHDLGKDEARRRLVVGVDDFVRQISGSKLARVEHAWDGDLLRFSARALGQGITGRLEVQDTAIRVEIDLPRLLAGMAGRIQGRLSKRGQLMLEKK